MNEEQKAKPSLSTLLDINPEDLKESKVGDSSGRNSSFHIYSSGNLVKKEIYSEYPAFRSYTDSDKILLSERDAEKASIQRRNYWSYYYGNDVNPHDRVDMYYLNRASDPNLQVVNNRNAIDEVANASSQKEDVRKRSVPDCFVPDDPFGELSRSLTNEEMESHISGTTAGSFVPIISNEPMTSFEEEMDLNALKPSLSDVIHSEEFLQNISSLPNNHAYHGADTYLSEDGSGIYTAAIDDEDIRKAYAGKNGNNGSSLADNGDPPMVQSGCSEEEQIFSGLPSRNTTDKLVLRDCDVLFGRGKRSYEHKGNERFRKVVDELKPLYAEQTDKEGKKKISICVMETVHAYGGKFLQIVSSNPFLYEEVETNKARKKCSQRLRE